MIHNSYRDHISGVVNNFTSQTRLVESSTFKAPDSQCLHFSLGMQTLVPTDGSPMPPHLRPELEKMLRRLFRAFGSQIVESIREEAKNGGETEMEGRSMKQLVAVNPLPVIGYPVIKCSVAQSFPEVSDLIESWGSLTKDKSQIC